MIRELKLVVTCQACPYQIEGYAIVENGVFDKDEFSMYYVYYRERHDTLGIGISTISLNDAVQTSMNNRKNKEDLMSFQIATKRIVKAIREAHRINYRDKETNNTNDLVEQ